MNGVAPKKNIRTPLNTQQVSVSFCLQWVKFQAMPQIAKCPLIYAFHIHRLSPTTSKKRIYTYDRHTRDGKVGHDDCNKILRCNGVDV